LDRAGVLEWVEDPRKEVPFDILIAGYAPDYSEKVRDYLTLLELQMPTEESELDLGFSDIWDELNIAGMLTFDARKDK